ncbi:hypothetical protein [Shewanella chilikensis]|uniref:hypothetical protein n=1 Tax=Shewanella chilikensis TaxID=558541 RepID=UPI00399A41B1
MPLNVWVLMLAQAFAMSATPIMVLLGGIIGAELSPVPSLSTLPIAMMVVGVAVAIVPINILMQRLGRRRVFIGGALLTSVAGVMAALSVWYAQFWGFCASGLLLGCGGAIIQQYRFAAMESVAPTCRHGVSGADSVCQGSQPGVAWWLARRLPRARTGLAGQGYFAGNILWGLFDGDSGRCAGAGLPAVLSR